MPKYVEIAELKDLHVTRGPVDEKAALLSLSKLKEVQFALNFQQLRKWKIRFKDQEFTFNATEELAPDGTIIHPIDPIIVTRRKRCR